MLNMKNNDRLDVMLQLRLNMKNNDGLDVMLQLRVHFSVSS